MAEVVLKKVSKRWDNFTAVDSFDLTIANGEFLILVGPSGCGKSTTLRMIAGLEDPTAGEIHINGVDVTEREPKDRGIAMVFQNYALYPHMTVGENIGFGLKVRGVSRSETAAEVKAVAELLGISDLLARRPKALSGGQRQRVALGRAIVRKPAVFLMDEPLSNLDAKLRVVMRAELIKLHQKLASTFVYVTHDQTEAMTMGSRIVVMKDGIVQQVGSPDEIYNRPANMFVAGFIGSPPMNFVEGSIEGGKGDWRFVGRRFAMPLQDDLADASALAAGREVVLGIRPEHMSIATVVVTVFLATFSGYALSRLRFRFRQKILIGILVTQMFPMVVLLIPLYILYLKAHLLNTWVGLVLAFTSFALPFGVWMIKGFIDTVPVEMEEAAMIDGCSRIGALFKVVLPMATPGIVATAIFAFLDAWNNLLFPLTLVNELEMKTLPPGMILSFMGQFRADWGGMMATSFLTTLPIVVLFVLVQRYLVAGLTAGAVKG